MKLTTFFCVLLCGCAAPQMTLVNNTDARLNVIAGNQTICTNLLPGQTVPIPNDIWKERIGVAVVGYDASGSYVGANDWTFYCGLDQVWRIDRLNKPQP